MTIEEPYYNNSSGKRLKKYLIISILSTIQDVIINDKETISKIIYLLADNSSDNRVISKAIISLQKILITNANNRQHVLNEVRHLKSLMKDTTKEYLISWVLWLLLNDKFQQIEILFIEQYVCILEDGTCFAFSLLTNSIEIVESIDECKVLFDNGYLSKKNAGYFGKILFQQRS